MKHWKPSTESYLGFLLVCAGVLPSFFWGMHHDVTTYLFSQFTPITMFAWIFSVSGMRRATGVARLAAIASLTVLALQAVLFAMIALTVAIGPELSK